MKLCVLCDYQTDRNSDAGTAWGGALEGGTEGGNPVIHDEVDCITRAIALYDRVLDDADVHQSQPAVWDDPEAEVRDMLPRLLAWLSPDARALMRDHLTHTSELVAFVHRVGTVNETTRSHH